MKGRKRRARRDGPASRASRDPGSNLAPDEVTAAVSAQIARCVARAIDQAAILENIGSQAFSAVGELARSAPATDLLHKAHALHGLVLHALTAVAELQNVAGHLAAFAAVREAASQDDVPPGGLSRP
jgi:hypothetical protein